MGDSNIIGKPLYYLLKNLKVDVTILGKKDGIFKNTVKADILVVAI